MSDILEQCPFCGNEADFFVREHWYSENYKSLIIECRECFANMELMIDMDSSIEDFEKAKQELFEVWNRRIERVAKAIEHNANVTDINDNIYYRTEYLCNNCKKKVLSGDDYCSHCGAKLDWSGNE